MAQPRPPKSPPPTFVGTSQLSNGQVTIDFRTPGPPRMIYKYAGDDGWIRAAVRWAGHAPGKALKAVKAKVKRGEMSLHAREMLCPRCHAFAREGAVECLGCGGTLPPWPAALVLSEVAGGTGRRRAKIVATLISERPTKHGRAAFLRLSRPVPYREIIGGGTLEHADHAVVSESATYDPDTREPIIVETAIFPAYPDGRIRSHKMLVQLPSVTDWRRAVKKASWELVEPVEPVAPSGGKRRARGWRRALPAGWRLTGGRVTGENPGGDLIGGWYVTHWDTGFWRGPFRTRDAAVDTAIAWERKIRGAALRPGGKRRADIGALAAAVTKLVR